MIEEPTEEFDNVDPIEAVDPPPRVASSIVGVAKEYNNGAWGPEEEARLALARAGFNATVILREADLQRNPGQTKSLETLAMEFLAGDYGPEPAAVRKLNRLGYSGRLVAHEARFLAD